MEKDARAMNLNTGDLKFVNYKKSFYIIEKKESQQASFRLK